MTKLLEKTDVKKLILWLFASNIVLIKIIAGGAVYMHNSTIEEFKIELHEAKQERKELRNDFHKLAVKVAELKP